MSKRKTVQVLLVFSLAIFATLFALSFSSVNAQSGAASRIVYVDQPFDSSSAPIAEATATVSSISVPLYAGITVLDPIAKTSTEIRTDSGNATDAALGTTLQAVRIAPDGKSIALAGYFVPSPDASGTVISVPNIFVIGMDDTNLHQVSDYTAATNNCINNFAWSPDGTQLLYEQCESDDQGNATPGSSAVFLVNADGKSKPQQLQLSSPLTFTGGANLAWLADGKHVLIEAFQGTTVAQGTRPTLLNLDLGSQQVSPFSSDKNYYLQSASQDGNHLLMYDADSQTQVITDAAGANAQTAVFSALPQGTLTQDYALSPDGTQLAFVGYQPVNDANGNQTGITDAHIYVMNADGSNPQIAADVKTTGTSVGVSNLSWGAVASS